MSYAVKNDGSGWRAVNKADDVGPDETFSETQPALTFDFAWMEYQRRAQVALDRSDTTILRCAEAGVVVPAAWAAYRKSLRAIIGAKTGDATAALPAQPAYPAGT